jgi:hypothetical protein
VALLANLSRGFRGAVGVIGDPTRPPVTAWSKELGGTYDDGRLHTQVALFRLDVSNERILDPVTREVSDAGESVRQGVSLDLTWTAVPRLRLLLEGTYNDAKITGVTESGEITVPDGLAAAVAGRPLVPNLHDVPLTPGSTVPGVARWLGHTGVEADLLTSLTTRALVRFSGPFTPIGEPGVPHPGVCGARPRRIDPPGGLRHDARLRPAQRLRYPVPRAQGLGIPESRRAAEPPRLGALRRRLMSVSTLIGEHHMRSTLLARCLPALLLTGTLGACSDDESPSGTEDHTPTTYSVLVNGTETQPPFALVEGQAVTVQLKFFNAEAGGSRHRGGRALRRAYVLACGPGDRDPGSGPQLPLHGHRRDRGHRHGAR